MNVHELAISSRPHFRNAGPCSTGHDPEHARNDPRCEHWRQQGPARPSIEFASPQRRPPEPCSLGSGSSNASSNTDTPGRTDADPLGQNRADHPTGRTVSNGLNTDRARLLIRGAASFWAWRKSGEILFHVGRWPPRDNPGGASRRFIELQQELPVHPGPARSQCEHQGKQVEREPPSNTYAPAVRIQPQLRHCSG